MEPVFVEQKKLTNRLRNPERRESEDPGGGTVTSVGFEWDIAELKTDSAEHPNILQGLTHVELAESSKKQFGLGYFLETDAGNVVEFVTAPFLVETLGVGSPHPDPDRLNEIKNAIKSTVDPIVTKSATLKDMFGDQMWRQFQFGDWVERNIGDDVEARNWSWASGKSGEQLKEAAGTIGSIMISKPWPSAGPQINYATTGVGYTEALESGGSRLDKGGKKSQRVEALDEFDALRKQLDRFVFNQVREPLARLDTQTAGRSAPVVARIREFLVESSAVPAIRALYDYQKTGFATGQEKAGMKPAAYKASFVKDRTAVWLKSDLFTFAASVLDPTDWPAMLDAVESIARSFDQWKVGKRGYGGDATKEALLEGLRAYHMLVKEVSASSNPDYGTIFERIAKGLPKINEHQTDIPGVRQDTFVPPNVMAEWARRLNLGGPVLHVVEVRNTGEFLSWLATQKRASASLETARPNFDLTEDTKKATPSPTFDPWRSAKEYETHMDFIRQTMSSLVQQEGVNGLTYETHPLSDQQIKMLRDRLVLPTRPDGDCLITSVLESAGLTLSPRDVRARVATRAAQGEPRISRSVAEKMLEPGNFEFSHLMQEPLAEELSVRITILPGDGTYQPAFGPENAEHEVILVHVDGNSPHFYGTTDG